MMRKIEETRRGIEEKKRELAGRVERYYRERRKEGTGSQREGDLGAGRKRCEETSPPMLKDTDELSQSLLTVKLSTDPELPHSPSSASSTPSHPFPPNRPSLPQSLHSPSLQSSLVSILDEDDPSALLKLQVELQIRLIREQLESDVRDYVVRTERDA